MSNYSPVVQFGITSSLDKKEEHYRAYFAYLIKKFAYYICIMYTILQNMNVVF